MMVFGDSGNDLDMIKMAGIGVAMANAEPEVLKAADFVTKSNNENGVGGIFGFSRLLKIVFYAPLSLDKRAGVSYLPIPPAYLLSESGTQRANNRNTNYGN